VRGADRRLEPALLPGLRRPAETAQAVGVNPHARQRRVNKPGAGRIAPGPCMSDLRRVSRPCGSEPISQLQPVPKGLIDAVGSDLADVCRH
jgi:hypothetical protein